ncbi:hypothetical protein [Glaesserella parasuis]|uniref:hypothetical protein n=1 Tax=Glaesserella parasuis TaxID=738 RepID=UPI0003ABD812|nr:hypothetical protein [Glaesserella parasuis]EQA07866.1 hypothetical protein HPS8415995_1765 [Glaesserella parasuis 84-15995]MDD2157521.1 hypothetical protein [Glaesserella parasuis]MDP0467386.1 hypothetical protein [Glaesserella parasuis]
MRRFAIVKLFKKLRSWWVERVFRKQKPAVATRRDLLKMAVKQGNQSPVGRAKRGRYD